MGLPWMSLVLVLVVLQRSSGASYPGEGEEGTNTSMILRPDCPSKCGDMSIPYPFGLWDNCSLPGFQVDCANASGVVGPIPKIFSEYFLSISLLQAQVRVLIRPSKVCKSDSNNWWVNLYGKPFTFSDTLNSFTAIGCDNLALLTGTFGGNYTVGCVSTCGEDTGDAKNMPISEKQDQLSQVVDGKCSGIGCCQASVPAGLSRYYTALKHLNIDSSTFSIKNSGRESCGFAFVVENGNYTFQKKDIYRPANTSDWILQAVLDWTIGNQTCEQAKKNVTSYACKSNNSECINSTTGLGYVCNCSKGYYGNPYLHGGCQDIDECEHKEVNPCYQGGLAVVPGGVNQTCINLPGSFNCTCSSGFTIVGDLCSPNGQDHSKTANGIIIGISCGSMSLLFLIIAGLARKRLRKKRMNRRRQKYFRQNYDLLLQQQLIYGENENIVDIIRFFSMKKLEKATEKFDSSRIVGNGGHGTVYKGILDLQVVAIKKSKLDIRIEAEQFINEIILLSQINHRNVVKLIGCCLEAEVPLLVYEFIPNGTLFHHLHDSSRGTLSWDDRLRIATEISSALAYMHSAANVSILHRDIKSLNILLDDKLTAKISDFGASRMIDFDQTHVSTNIQGTLGYLDPEYMQTGQLTEKSDVYSLGVILLELLMGEKPSSKASSVIEGNMTSRFFWAYKSNQLFQVLESSILEDANKEEVEAVSELAMASLSLRGKDRPTVKEVEMRLEGLMRGKKKMKKQATYIDQFDDIDLSNTASFLHRNGSLMTESTSREVSVVGLVPAVKGLVR